LALLLAAALPIASCSGPGAVKAKGHQVNHAACHDGAVYFLETGGEYDGATGVSASSWLVRLPLGAGQTIERVAALPDVECWLVAGEDRLWVLSAGNVCEFKDGKLTTTPLETPLGKVSKPFLYKGAPALIAAEAPGYRLMLLADGKWKPDAKLRMRLPAETDDCTGEYLQASEIGDVLHVFAQVPLAAPVYHHVGLPLADADQEWEKVADAPGQWKAVGLDGKPALVFHSNRDGPVALGLIKRDGKWEEFFSRAIGLDIGMGVCPTGDGADFVLLRRILPLGLRIVGVEKGEPAWVFEGEGSTNLVEKLTE